MLCLGFIYGRQNYIYIYIYILSGCKKRSERFSYVFCTDVFPTFLSPFFLRFSLSFFLRFFVVFPTFFTLAGQYWKAAELRHPGGLQAGASEVAFLCPNVFSTIFNVFCTFFTVTIPCPPLEEICLQGERVGGWIEKDTVFPTFLCPFFLRFLLSFFLHLSFIFYTCFGE